MTGTTGPVGPAPPGGAPAPWLLADIGGTKTRFSLCPPGGAPGATEVYYNKDHSSLAAAARDYLARAQPAAAPQEAALCVAGPIAGDEVGLTNFGWSFSIKQWRADMGLRRLEVINDFTAIALAVPHLRDQDVRQLGGGAAQADAVIGIIGPGTGLGVSGLVRVNGRWTALRSEGGHISLAASNPREADVIAWLRGRYGSHVSAERAISGPGLCNLYLALCDLDGVKAEDLQPREIATLGAAPGAAIGAAGGNRQCAEACTMFSAMLGTVAGDLALTLGAHGGVYIAGGVVHNMGEAFDGAVFRDRFDDKGRLRAFVAPIPAFAITVPWPALIGLAAVLGTPAHE